MQESLQDQSRQVQVFKALADPTRLKILKLLKHTDHEMTCGEVGQLINISKTSGSYHFKLLQAAGLISVRKVAREKYVTIDQSGFKRTVTDFYHQL